VGGHPAKVRGRDASRAGGVLPPARDAARTGCDASRALCCPVASMLLGRSEAHDRPGGPRQCHLPRVPARPARRVVNPTGDAPGRNRRLAVCAMTPRPSPRGPGPQPGRTPHTQARSLFATKPTPLQTLFFPWARGTDLPAGKPPPILVIFLWAHALGASADGPKPKAYPPEAHVLRAQCRPIRRPVVDQPHGSTVTPARRHGDPSRHDVPVASSWHARRAHENQSLKVRSSDVFYYLSRS
jgi:hypothetical protein